MSARQTGSRASVSGSEPQGCRWTLILSRRLSGSTGFAIKSDLAQCKAENVGRASRPAMRPLDDEDPL